MSETDPKIISDSGKLRSLILVSLILLFNFLVRFFIWSQTELFSFSDYQLYINGAEKLVKGDSLYILSGNFLYGISYLGFFAEKFLGSLDYFFVINCLIASLTSLTLYILVVRITGNRHAGIITIVIQTFYSEFMVFSSVFYSPILMMFLLSLFILLLYYYITENNYYKVVSSAMGLIIIFLITFFFKPELHYLPWFLVVFSFLVIKANRPFFLKILSLSFLLLSSYFFLSSSGLITHFKGNVISNSFVFFGHTDYGGDGGEGSFIYPENKARYEVALAEYCKSNKITSPTTTDINDFQINEIKKYIINHPGKWVRLQLTKFFRTFGVVPEATSFKVLYTGLLNENLWLTSIVVVVPVALIILLFILFFDFSAIKQLMGRRASGVGCQGVDEQPATSTQQPAPTSSSVALRRRSNQQQFLSVYLLLFVYYLIATVFYGQYQERYRMPMMVIFIIPSLGYFMASFKKIKFLKRSSLVVKGITILLFLTIWTFQAEKALSNKQRLNKALESVIPINPDA